MASKTLITYAHNEIIRWTTGWIKLTQQKTRPKKFKNMKLYRLQFFAIMDSDIYVNNNKIKVSDLLNSYEKMELMFILEQLNGGNKKRALYITQSSMYDDWTLPNLVVVMNYIFGDFIYYEHRCSFGHEEVQFISTGVRNKVPTKSCDRARLKFKDGKLGILYVYFGSHLPIDVLCEIKSHL